MGAPDLQRWAGGKGGDKRALPGGRLSGSVSMPPPVGRRERVGVGESPGRSPVTKEKRGFK